MARWHRWAALSSLCSLPLVANAQSTEGAGRIRSAGDTLELVDHVGALTESPVVAHDGSVYFVDLDLSTGGSIWRWDPATRQRRLVLSPSGLTAGLALAANDDLFTAELANGGGRRIGRVNPSSGSDVTVVDRYQGKPIHGANDLVSDDAGRLYFTEYVFLGQDEVLHRQGSGVYRIDPDGTLSRIIPDAGSPNGIAVSPDQQTLYVASNRFDAAGHTAILAYDLSPEGQARYRSVLVRYAPGQVPDGITVDSDGNIYVAMFAGRAGVAVYDPAGAELDFIATSGPATNVAFAHGADASVLYVTAANGLYRLRTNRQGHHPSFPGR